MGQTLVDATSTSAALEVCRVLDMKGQLTFCVRVPCNIGSVDVLCVFALAGFIWRFVHKLHTRSILPVMIHTGWRGALVGCMVCSGSNEGAL
jgi:hypothetical protein